MMEDDAPPRPSQQQEEPDVSPPPQQQKRRSTEDNRRDRLIDAGKFKDEQIRILTDENKQLTKALEQVEEDLSAQQAAKDNAVEESRALREMNCRLHAKIESSEGHATILVDRAKEMETMATKNAELFRLLEQEESNNEKITSELELCKKSEKCLQEKHAALMQSYKVADSKAESATRDNRLKTEEIRVLRLEVEQLRQAHSDLQIKSTVELEAAQEQLRLRKEKQYQLLGKLQSHEVTTRQTEEHTAEMEKNIKELRERSSELQTALRLETSARISENDANRRLSVELKTLSSDNKDLNSSLQSLEQERLALEAEARGNGEQLREMAEKVFQLLERVKLAELGKKKSTEALSRKEQELFATKKQYNRLSEDVLDQKRRREKIEIEKRALEEQLRGLKKANNQLGHKLKEEAKLRIKAEEAAQVSDEKVHKLDGRIAFLLNKLQLDEETITVQQEEMKKVDTQLQAIKNRCESLQGKLTQADEYGRATDAKLKTSQKELKDVKINLEAMERSIKAKEANELDVERRALRSTSADKGGKTNGSRQSRFYVDFRSSVGHAAITGKVPRDKAWIEEKGCNSFLRRTFKSHNPQEALVKKMAEMYNTISFDEEDKEELQRTIKSRDKDIESLNRELTRMQTNVCSEEESKRRILLRYIRAVKASVSL